MSVGGGQEARRFVVCSGGPRKRTENRYGMYQCSVVVAVAVVFFENMRDI